MNEQTMIRPGSMSLAVGDSDVGEPGGELVGVQLGQARARGYAGEDAPVGGAAGGGEVAGVPRPHTTARHGSRAAAEGEASNIAPSYRSDKYATVSPVRRIYALFTRLLTKRTVGPADTPWQVCRAEPVRVGTWQAT